MKQRPRIYYSDSQKALMWERWKKGESLQQIAQLFDRNHSSVGRILAETGGIRPAQRCRSQVALSLAEREEISRGLMAGQSIRSIALQLDRAPSTVSREINRNGGAGSYRATLADEAAWIGPTGPSSASWFATEPWPVSWPASSNASGHPSKLQDGSSILTRATRTIRCHTKPSTAVCSFKPGAL